MKRKYKIKWQMPQDYDASVVLRKLPSPISRQMSEIYNYVVEENGFCLVDNGVDQTVAGHALKLFIDEALTYSEEVSIRAM